MIHRARALALAALCVCACKEKPAEPAPPPEPAAVRKPPPLAPIEHLVEIEPNDFQRAQQIPSRATVRGSIAPPKPRAVDEDWYRVAAGSAPLALHVELAPLSADGGEVLDAMLEVLDRDRNRLVRVHAGSDGAVVPAVACVESCFVKVEGKLAAHYLLTVLGAPPQEGQELEPNDRAVDAQPLAPGKGVQGMLATADDEDWYRVAVPSAQAGQFLRVEVSAVPGVRPELEVRALSDGALLATVRAAAAGEGLFVRDLALWRAEEPGDAGMAGAPDAGPLAARGAGGAASAASPQSDGAPAPVRPDSAAALEADGGAREAAAADAGSAEDGGADERSAAQASGSDAGQDDAGTAGRDTSADAGAAGSAAATGSTAQSRNAANGTAASPAANGSAASPAANGSAASPAANGGAASPAANGGAASPAANGSAASPAANGTAASPAAKGSAAGGSPSSATAPAADAGAAAAATPAPAAGFYLVLKSAWIPSAAPKGKASRGANAKTPYLLTTAVESGPADLELEPNDDLQHATPLTASRSGWLSPPGDADWFRVHAVAPSVLHAEVTALERADLELSAWAAPEAPGEKPTLLARVNEGGVREGEILPGVSVPAGDSYLLVQPAQRQLEGKWVRDGEDRQTLYKLTASLTPDDGSLDREPNNDADTAQPIPLPATVRGTIWPHRDVDLFRFHVEPGHAPFNFRLSAVRGMDLMLRLHELKPGRDGKLRAEIIGSADSVHGEGEEHILSVPLKQGDYAIEVSSPRGKDASASQQYTLSVE